MVLKSFFAPFGHFYFFNPKSVFCMGYSLCIVAIFGNFQNALIFGILGGFLSGFLHTTTLMWSYNRFSHRLGNFYFLTQTEYFAWAIAFALWPFLAIFKMLLFFEC